MGRTAKPTGRPYERPIRSFYPDAQVLVCRPEKPTSTTLSACIRGGHNACPHNHNDIGQYAIARGDIQVVEDPSGAIYTPDTFSARRYDSPILNSHSHAVPRPDRTLQSAGKQFASKILGHGFAPDRDWLLLDLAGAYAMTNAAMLVKLTRRFEYERAVPAVTVEDEVAFSDPAAFETPVSTLGEVIPGPKPDMFIIRHATPAGEASLVFTVDAHGTKWHAQAERIVNPRREGPLRWAVVLDEPVRAAKVTIRYRDELPADTGYTIGSYLESIRAPRTVDVIAHNGPLSRGRGRRRCRPDGIREILPADDRSRGAGGGIRRGPVPGWNA